MEYIQDTLFGKMYPEHSVQTKEKTLDVSLNHCAESLTKKFMCLRLTNGNKQDVSWGDISQLLGEYWMLNIGESPKEENASTLSQILMANVPQKYFLSPKACLGILRRASNRGKELPEVLRVALERQASLDKEAYANISDGIAMAAVALENHPLDSRVTISEDDKVQTLTSRMGTGGGNVPMVMEPQSIVYDGAGITSLINASNPQPGDPCHTLSTDSRNYVVICLQGNGIDRTDTAGCNGKDLTLATNNDQTLFVPMAFGICSKDSNAMKSANPHSGIYQAETARTLDGNGGNPSCNQGGIAVVCVDQGGGKSSCSISEELSPTLTCTHGGEPAVAYGIDRAAYNQGVNAKYDFSIEENLMLTMVAKGANACAYGFYPQMKAECVTFTEEKSGCLVNGTNPGYQNGVVDNHYIVRRLTPTECARLQGFPDWWCDDLGIAEPTDEDIAEWREIFDTHAKALGKGTKPKTDAQIRKWLINPHSDSAEYKMWGNGVALPCVFYVLNSIMENEQEGCL